MVHGACQIRIRKGDPAKRCSPKNLPRRWSTVPAEEESWLWTEIGVSPPVKYDSGDIPCSIQAGTRKHVAELFPDLPFIVSERRSQHFSAASLPLFFGRVPGIGVQNF